MIRFHPILLSLSLLATSLLPVEAGARASKPKPAPLSAEEVATRKTAAKAVLDRWLAAQNQRDFDAYMALYAPRFHGVRRSRLQTVRLDRAGWAKERGKMFAKPMSVSVDDLQIMPGKAAISVLFTQHWSSGNYADTGPKRMVLAELDGTWLISEEEMLASHAPGKLTLLPETVSGQFAFVEKGDVVLAQTDRLCDGPSTLDEDGGDYTISCPVKPVSIPKELSAWKSERVTLYGQDGKGCTTRLSAFATVGRVYLMGGMDEEADGGEGVSERARHDAIWSNTAPLLVGKMTECSGDYVWARLASLPKPVRAEIAELPDGLVQGARRAFHDLPAWAEEQKSCGEGGKSWEDLAQENTQSLITARVGGERLRYVSRLAQTGDCGASCGLLFGLFQVGGNGKQTRFTPIFTDQKYRTLLGAFDSDGDGNLEFLYREGYYDTSLILLAPDRSSNRVPKDTVETFHFHGCGC
jgi:hypothetical protein